MRASGRSLTSARASLRRATCMSPCGNALAHPRDDLAVAVDVLVGVVAAQQKGRHADVVVVEQGLGHGGRGADQGSGVSCRACRGGEGHEQAAVEYVALAGGLEESL